MKRNVLVLVLSLLLLSFGLSNAATSFRVELTGAGQWNDGGTVTINPGVQFTINMYGTTSDNFTGFSMPFEFYGAGSPALTNVTWGADTASYDNPAFAAIFAVFWGTYFDLGWDGVLPDRYNETGASTSGWPATEQLLFSIPCTVPMGSDGGQLCVDSATTWSVDPTTYGWAFDPAANFGDPVCFPVKTLPNAAPVFTNCPVQLSSQFSTPFHFDFNATDAEQDAITFSIVGPGSINATTGVWDYTASCQDVGQSITLVVCASDPTHACPTGSECTVNIVVQNTAPTIVCGASTTVGTSGGTIQVTGSDANKPPDILTYSMVSHDPTTGTIVVDANTGVVTFTPGGADDAGVYNFTVMVTDCAGATAECSSFFNLVLTNPFYVKIAKAEGATGKGVLQGHHTLLDVTACLNTAAAEVWGFDFLIAYDASVLSLTNVVKGDLFDIPGTYEWEYLTYRFGATGNCGNGCPTGIVRVIAIADQNDGYHHPKVKVVPCDFVLFQLDFLVSSNLTYECMYVPVNFFWTDCGDNTLAMRFPQGYGAAVPPIPPAENDYDVITVLNSGIYAFDDPLRQNSIADGGSEFPTFEGAPDSCLTYAILAKRPYRLVDFINGGIDIICTGEIDARGDVNLNGISNEIGDAVVFTNYFIAGLAAFTVNIEGQIAATDVNADGTTLSVADLVYLVRVIVGDALPYPKLNPNAGSATFTSNGSTISTDVELGALYVVMNGHADVSLADGAANMQLKTGVVDGNTVALVYSFEKGQTCTGNILNTNGTILRTEAADYNGSTYKTGIDNLPTSFSLTNYPNPFNPTTTISMALPVASNWTISIYNVVGQKVAAFDGYSEAGIVTVNWNASNQASGVYFYKAEAGKFSATKKMALLK